jgi:hypothetical protein
MESRVGITIASRCIAVRGPSLFYLPGTKFDPSVGLCPLPRIACLEFYCADWTLAAAAPVQYTHGAPRSSSRPQSSCIHGAS